MASRFGFPASARLRRQSDFDAVFAAGTRVHGRFVTVIGRRTEGPLRVGIPCGRRFSKRAVDRNRFRRLVRESFRLVRAQLPAGLDVVVLPRCKPGEPTFAALSVEVPELVRRVARKLEETPAPASKDKP
ncbi:MAG TPA: ribonuclease P protein component [Planctomycetota bacterium]|nr:ribonuclease P protein component [Planctomycetota bacterium]